MEHIRTPNSPTSPIVYRQFLITVPNIPDIETVLWGSVLGVSFNTAWEKSGTMETREAADYIKQILKSRLEFSMIGTIQAIFTEEVPPTMLLMDGTTYNESDYPELYAVLHNSFKGGGTFFLPDLTNRFLLGIETYGGVGSTDGNEYIHLNVTQLPSHSHETTPHAHSEIIAVPSVINGGLEAPASAAQASTGFTSLETVEVLPTGGGEDIWIMPPYMMVRYAIVAKVQP